MARPLDVTLHEKRAVAERGLGLARRRRERGRQLVRATDPHHAASAAARRRLQQHREAHPLGRGERVGCGVGAVRARPDRDAQRARQRPRLDLVAAAADHLRGRPDERQPGQHAGLRQLGALRQEPVAGVYGVAAGRDRRPDDRSDVQVAARSGRRADPDDPVGPPCGQAVDVGVGDGGHTLDALVEARAGDAHRDLAAVGDEHAAQRGRGHDGASAGKSTSAVTPLRPAPTRILSRLPPRWRRRRR
jgi:hypothetical protein